MEKYISLIESITDSPSSLHLLSFSLLSFSHTHTNDGDAGLPGKNWIREWCSSLRHKVSCFLPVFKSCDLIINHACMGSGGRGESWLETGKRDSWDLRDTEPLIYLNLTGETSADPAPRGKPHTGDLGGGWRGEQKVKQLFWHSVAPISPLARGSPTEVLVSDQSDWSIFLPWKSWCKKRKTGRLCREKVKFPSSKLSTSNLIIELVSYKNIIHYNLKALSL